MLNLGDFATGATLYIPFESTLNGVPITMTGLATTDVEVYKDGGTTQRTSDAGFTLLDTDGIDFDGVTGLHGISIDLSDNTHAGFYAAGSDYWVLINAITVNGNTVSPLVAVFSIANRVSGAPAGASVSADIAAAKVDTAAILVDTADMQPKIGTPAADLAADVAAVKVDTAATLIDTAEIGSAGAGLSALATAANLATVDTVVDAILVDTADMQPKLGSPAADLAADIAAAKVDTAAILVDTADMQPKLGSPAADVSADIAAVKVDTAATLVDTTVIGAAGAGLTDLGGMSTGMKAEVNAEADTAITDAALATAASLATVDTVVDAIKVITDALGATGAARLALSAGQIVPGTVDTASTASTTTTFEADDITEATADHYNGRIVVWTSGVLAGQATDITDYSLVGSNGSFTVTAMTEAPGNNDTFIVV